MTYGTVETVNLNTGTNGDTTHVSSTADSVNTNITAHGPPGVTTTLLLVLFFGSVNLLGISIIGEYVAKVFEEVKHRPLFIRRSVIRDGEVRPAADCRTRNRGGPESCWT